MKKVSKYHSLLLIPFFFACGGGDKGGDQGGEKGPEGGEPTKSEIVGEVEKPAIIKQFADVAALADKKAFTSDEFSRATIFLFKQEATISGYPYAYSADTEVKFKPNSTFMCDGEDNSVKTIDVKIKFKDEKETKMLPKGKKFAVHGKLDVGYNVRESSDNSVYIKVYDAEFVDAAEGPALNSVADIDLGQTIFCGDLLKVMNAHYGKLYAKPSIEITGDYKLTNTSTTSYGTTIDVVLGSNPVHCHVKDAPEEGVLTAIRTAGEQVTISGKFAGSGYTPKIDQGVIK